MTAPRALLGVTVAAAVLCAAVAAGPNRLPGAHTIGICDAAGDYWPTMTLALDGTSAWVACKEESRVVRVDTKTRKAVRSIALQAPAIAVASGAGAIWALDASSTLYRIDSTSGKVVKRIALPMAAPYNIWIGGGSVWVADDQGAEVVRVAPQAGRVVARIPVGDGPADMAFNGGTAWVINHRDRVLSRIDLATNKSEELVKVGGDAPERMVFARGALWITGRGTDLLKVDPDDGSPLGTIEIGASGIDIGADGGTIWIPTRSAPVDVRGFPTMNALDRVSMSTGAVSTVARSRGRVDVHGLVVRDGTVWIADNTNGLLYQVR